MPFNFLKSLIYFVLFLYFPSHSIINNVIFIVLTQCVHVLAGRKNRSFTYRVKGNRSKRRNRRSSSTACTHEGSMRALRFIPKRRYFTSSTEPAFMDARRIGTRHRVMHHGTSSDTQAVNPKRKLDTML